MSLPQGIWSNFTKRASSLGVANKSIQKALLNAKLPNGPASLKKRSSKVKYQSPEGMDEIYPLAYKYLQEQSEKSYHRAESLERGIQGTKDEALKQKLADKRTQMLIDAERFNPEVVYNSEFATKSLDKTQPVYRWVLEQKWKEYGRMLTMQRLESLGVIPDTMPTLEPEVDVKLQFPCNNVETFVEPGTILSSNVTCRPPSFDVTEFRESVDDLYTILIVDPDVPDVATDGYTTSLLWALKDVPASNSDTVIDAKKLTANPGCELVSYQAPTPEKNSGNHRISVWVYRQSKKLGELSAPSRESFDIRQFASEHDLKAVGAHVWRSAWDRNTEKVREMYGLPHGRVFTRERN